MADVNAKNWTGSIQADGLFYSKPSKYVSTTFRFSSSLYEAQGGDTINIQVQRQGSGAGAVSVHWALTGLTEGAPAITSGNLNWASGDTSPKSITMTLGSVTLTRNGTLTLSSPTGTPTPTLGTPSTATLTIYVAAGATATAYNLNDIDAMVLVPGQTNVRFGATNLEATWNAGALPNLVMVAAGGDPTSVSAVTQTYTGSPVIDTAVGGSLRMLGHKFTVVQGTVPYGPVDFYLVSADKTKVSTPCRMWLVDPAELSATVSTTEVSGIKALWPTTAYVKVFKEDRPASSPGTVTFGWNGSVKSPIFDPADGTLRVRAFRNETLLWSEIIEAGAADVNNVTVELDPFVDSVNSVTLSNPARTAAQATHYYVSGQAVHTNVYVADYVQMRSCSETLTRQGGLWGPGGYNGYNQRETPLMFRMPESAVNIAHGGDTTGGTCTFSQRPFANKNVPYQLFTPEQLPSGNGSFTIPANTSKQIYIQHWVPKFKPGTAVLLPAGTYTSTFRVKVGGVTVKSHPIVLTVEVPAADANFALPDDPAVRYYGQFDNPGDQQSYGRMYGSLTKSTPTGTSDPNFAAYQNTVQSILRVFKRNKVEPGPTNAWKPTGWTDEWYGPVNPAQYDGTQYSTANGYAGPGANTPDKVNVCWYSKWRYMRYGTNLFRNGMDPTLSFISDISREATALVTCTAHGLEAGQYIWFTGMTAGTAWEFLNNRHYKITSIVNANSFRIALDTSGLATTYASAVGSLNAGFKEGPFPSRLWPLANQMVTAYQPYGIVPIIHIADELGPPYYGELNTYCQTFADNPGVGGQLQTALTVQLIQAYRGLANPAGAIRPTGVKILFDSDESNVHGIAENPVGKAAERQAAIAFFAAQGTQVKRYSTYPGDIYQAEHYGSGHAVHAWALWLAGYDSRLCWQVKGWENFGDSWSWGLQSNHNQLFTSPRTFGKEDAINTQMGRWTSSNLNNHENGNGSFVLPGRDAIFNEPQAYNLDLVMPRPTLLHTARGVDDVNIFAKAATLKGRSAVENIIRKVLPRTGDEIEVYVDWNARRTGHLVIWYANAIQKAVDQVRDLIMS